MAKKDLVLTINVEGLSQVREVVEEALARVAELQATFDLRWKADMRAIKMWQAAHPGTGLIWPDHADLVVWLLEQLEARAGLALTDAERQTVVVDYIASSIFAADLVEAVAKTSSTHVEKRTIEILAAMRDGKR